MNSLTRIDLDLMAAHGCETPGCSHETHSRIYFHGRCHPDEPTWAFYDASTGEVTVECAVCRKAIATIVVKERVAK